MKNFKLWNNLGGWVAFCVAAITYLMTMEPTASFWDCPEFITTAFKLEVGHPPGAPFFMLMGRFFSLFASDVEHVAMCINTLSALMSAFTILFLFWTISLLARKVILPKENNQFSLAQTIAILGASMVGALVYTFSDTFWFSAVEAEVYASSSFFTAIVFWAILKWDEEHDQPFANRWILLIAYLCGLSIGVHLLNLLAIPAIVLVYYYRKSTNPDWKGMLFALGISFGFIVAIMYGFIPGIMAVAEKIELLFVNTLGFSFNSGLIFFIILLSVSLIWTIYETYVQTNRTRVNISFLLSTFLMGITSLTGNLWIGIILSIVLGVGLFAFKRININILHVFALAMAMIAIGFSSYALIVVRSIANPPMDQNSPENVFTLASYLGREQYGDRPLFYGQYYNAPMDIEEKNGTYMYKTEEKGDIWNAKEKLHPDEPDQYIVTDKKVKYCYVDKFCTIFPRMYSGNGSHVNSYKQWVGEPEKKITYKTPEGEQTAYVPSFFQNVKFFVDYQFLYMYMRYFMWNFSGRQNDIQGFGECDAGMFLTGIPIIDELIEGDYDDLPTQMKENKGRNVYYMLPLLLGILGIIYQCRKKKVGDQLFWTTFWLFFMTGIAIVIYLNQTPLQPRERDYAYAASFYAYAIWIGFGVLGLMQILSKFLNNKTIVAIIATIVSLLVPVQMAAENWDDHDRSDRYLCRDTGYNYLMSCAPNAVIFTNGDNDTFPLWYLQEVEGVRTDVRVCNLSYLQTDWYIDQMRRRAYDSDSLPINWKRYQYVQGTRDYAFVKKIETFNSSKAISDVIANTPLKNLIDDYLLNDNNTKQQSGAGTLVVSGDSALIPLDVERYAKENNVPDSILNPQVRIPISKTVYYKHELMILEMLARSEWTRPIYFSTTVGSDYYMSLENNFQLEGLAYRIVPYGGKNGSFINTDIMYDKIMNDFRWGGMDKNPDMYLDETCRRMCSTLRSTFNQLASELIAEGKTEKAQKVLQKCIEVIPYSVAPYEIIMLYVADNFYKCNDEKNGDLVLNTLIKDYGESLIWSKKLGRYNMRTNYQENAYYMQHLLQVAYENDREQLLSDNKHYFQYLLK
jgi:hypothetical protein